MAESQLLATILAFIRALGIAVTEREIERPTLVSGIDIVEGGLVICERDLVKPADVLHEAAHIALTAPALRTRLDGTIDSSPAEELSSIAWTWAAALHLGIPPTDVFHEEVISGNGPTLLENFLAGHYIGVPMLARLGLTNERGDEAYPKMGAWMRA